MPSELPGEMALIGEARGGSNVCERFIREAGVSPDKSFDACLVPDAYEHIPSDQRPGLLREMVRVTQGVVLVACPMDSEIVSQVYYAAERDRLERNHPLLHPVLGLLRRGVCGDPSFCLG